MNTCIDLILTEAGIHPEQITSNGQTARERLEAAINGALDDIEDGD